MAQLAPTTGRQVPGGAAWGVGAPAGSLVGLTGNHKPRVGVLITENVCLNNVDF